MIRISLLTGELVFTALWLLCRAAVWVWQGRIDWKREAELLLMYINLAVLIRFVFYPFFKVNGQVQPLVIDPDKLFPPRINCIPFRNIIDYEIRREAVINIIGNICLFIPTGILLPILYRRLDSFRKVILTGAGLSLVIEIIQLLLPNSVTDIDDLMLNTLGVAIGYGIYTLVKSMKGNNGNRKTDSASV